MDTKAFLLSFLSNEIEEARFEEHKWSLMRMRTTLRHAKTATHVDVADTGHRFALNLVLQATIDPAPTPMDP